MIRDALGLSPEAIANRRKYICAGHADDIMKGNYNKPWREMKGVQSEEDLGGILRVMMGCYTEPFNLAWCEQQTGRKVEYYSDNPLAITAWSLLHMPDDPEQVASEEFVVSDEYPFMACNLDAMFVLPKFNKRGPLDAKHVATFKHDEHVATYSAKMTHQCIVTKTDCWALSVFAGNGRWELIEQQVDPFYREELIEKCHEFWGYVTRDEEPMDAEPVAAPKPQPRLRSIDMDAEIGSDAWKQFILRNQWGVDVANAIEQFADTAAAVKANGAARTAIKDALPDDVGELKRPTRHGLFLVKRATNGALTMTVGGKDG